MGRTKTHPGGAIPVTVSTDRRTLVMLKAKHRTPTDAFNKGKEVLLGNLTKNRKDSDEFLINYLQGLREEMVRIEQECREIEAVLDEKKVHGYTELSPGVWQRGKA